MSEVSRTYSRATWQALRNAISSPASEGGATRSDSPDGPTTGQCGPGVAPASRSASPGLKRVSKTLATSGPSSTASSPSDALQQSLENRLRELLRGSVSCEVIWKRWFTPWGSSLWRPRARTRTISGIGIGLWPTLTANSKATAQYNEAGNSAGQVSLRKIIIALWPTVVANDDNKTPAAHLAMKRRMGERDGTHSNRTAITSLQVMVKAMDIALWSTIRASDGAKGGPRMSFGAGGSPLPSQVSTVGNTSNAPTENGAGSLHPEFGGWELGYPPEWLNCAPSETPSTRARRRSSSKPI